jgi:hypothetical protein
VWLAEPLESVVLALGASIKQSQQLRSQVQANQILQILAAPRGATVPY